MTFFKKQKKSFLDIGESDIDSKFQGCRVKTATWRVFPEQKKAQKRPKMRKMGHFDPKKARNEKIKNPFFSCPEWVLNPKFQVESLKNGRTGPGKAPKCQKYIEKSKKKTISAKKRLKTKK